MERVVARLTSALQRSGFVVDEYASETLSPHRPFRRWPMLNRVAQIWRTARQFGDLLRTYDVVISHLMCGAFLRHPRRIYVHHSTMVGLPLVLREYMDPRSYLVARWLYGWVDRQAGAAATRVAVSRFVAQEARRFYRQEPHCTIHNAIDTAHFRNHDRARARARFALPQDRWVGLVVGRIEIGKGVHTLNALAPRLPERAVLAFAAPTVSSQFGIPPEKSILLGAVSYEDMPFLYSACDALVFPSLYESFGLVVIEALACGLPVVTSRVGIVHEMTEFHPAQDAMVVDNPRDVDAFLERIRRLIEDPGLGQAQVNWGVPFVRERFSLERFQRAYVKVIHDVLS